MKLGSKIKKLVLRLAVFFIFISLNTVIFYRFVPVYYTPLMFLRSAESIFSNKFVGIDKTWRSLDEISPAMQKAVLKAEDDRFFEHYGFDFAAIQKAMKYNQTHKRKKGASTISQQTAKNVFLWPQRDWIRKGFEVYFTVLIELFWPKSRIMEVYLNVVEFGPGVYGVEAASNKYFKKSAKNLSSSQASLMAAVLPNPRKFRIDRPSSFVLNRQSRILNRVSPPIPKDEESSLIDFFELKLDSDESEDDN
jgi:monofunctional glycosyltransferase